MPAMGFEDPSRRVAVTVAGAIEETVEFDSAIVIDGVDATAVPPI